MRVVSRKLRCGCDLMAICIWRVPAVETHAMSCPSVNSEGPEYFDLVNRSVPQLCMHLTHALSA